MNDSLIRKFCESPSRWPVVAIVTTVIALATAWPAADVYFDEKAKHAELEAQLAEAEATAAQLPAAEKLVATLDTRLGELEKRTVNEANVASFRSRLVGLIRDSGCQVRRLEVGAPTVRPWNQDDKVLEDMPPGAPLTPTPFVLERRSVGIAVDGPMNAITTLLERIAKEEQLAHSHRVHLNSAGPGGQTVSLELELWFFALARKGA